ncbi:MAG: hypothetical protein IB617_02820 [Candidatus Nealsonbacteria bacterium]|nr:MAG: hypothetical protein IB617_02820 [Candidatus Nealsonbacteria bacterium]
MKLLYEFIKGERKEHLWREKIEVYDDKKIKYSIFLPFPICKDGSKHKVCEELEKKGWKCENGRLKYGGLIYKEGLTYPEVINCIEYIKVYKKTYDFLTEQSPYVDIPLKIAKFFGIVDVKMNMERKYGRYSLSLKNISWVNLVQFLRKEGFTLVST